jgi:hypothetical protein
MDWHHFRGRMYDIRGRRTTRYTFPRRSGDPGAAARAPARSRSRGHRAFPFGNSRGRSVSTGHAPGRGRRNMFYINLSAKGCRRLSRALEVERSPDRPPRRRAPPGARIPGTAMPTAYCTAAPIRDPAARATRARPGHAHGALEARAVPPLLLPPPLQAGADPNASARGRPSEIPS